MQLKNTIENEPTLSNVGTVSAFTIKATAKSFQILSSGLYANKIKAIIREYSCNAVDSHVEAGRSDTPFDVHLPNALEPWFAVRDYGVGLDESQVRNIFTSFFESTKTESNDFIGALGLGSKSAFSFTDNFTIVAVKGGMKRVYTAFINEHGVPSIAPMGEEVSTDPNGVEIRFAVEDHYDFRKFQQEAASVYKYFKLRPVVSGASHFEFRDPKFADEHIIPGVHSSDQSYGSSFAIMGNIEYPIEVPNRTEVLGDLAGLLDCGLIMEFGIGELDIQASREGLSYIPETIAAIKAKLEVLNAQLTVRLAEQADAIENLWDRADYLMGRINVNLWSAAVNKYLVDTKFSLVDTSNRYQQMKRFRFDDKTLAEKYNIVIKPFGVRSYQEATYRINQDSIYDDATKAYTPCWGITVATDTTFVLNDTKVGASERAKYHFRRHRNKGGQRNVYVLEAVDKKKEVNTSQFFADISNPPASQIFNASDLEQRERAVTMASGVSILKLEKRDHHSRHTRSNDLVWRDAGKSDQFEVAQTFYYLPLKGFQAQGKLENFNLKTVKEALSNSGILTDSIYGVRKTDLETIGKMTNWINLDDFIEAELKKIGSLDVKGIVKKSVDIDDIYKYNVVEKVNVDSPYLKLYTEFKDVTAIDAVKQKGIEVLSTIYKISTGNVNVTDEVEKYRKEVSELNNRYPLLNELSYRYHVNSDAVAEYINAIDAFKGV